MQCENFSASWTSSKSVVMTLRCVIPNYLLFIYLRIFNLLKNTVDISGCIMSNDRMISKLKNVWKEVAVDHLLLRNLFEGLEKTTEVLS